MRRFGWTSLLALTLLCCKEKPLKPLEARQKDGMERMAEQMDTMKADPGTKARIAAASLAEGEQDRLPANLLRGLDDASGQNIDASQRSTLLFTRIDDDVWEKTCRDPKVRDETSGRSILFAEKSQKIYERCDFARFQLVTREQALAANPGALAVAMVMYDILQRHDSLVDVEKKLLAVLVVDSAGWGTDPRPNPEEPQ